MNYRASILLGALLAVGITACDPYEDEPGGTPQIISVTLTDSLTPTIVEDPTEAGTWAITGEDPGQNVLFVITNRLLDGSSIQTTPADCTPAGGWLNVETTAPAITCDEGLTPAFFTCYVPSSPAPGQGGSIAIFQACEAPSVDAGYFDLGEFAPNSTYRFFGQIRDGSGNPLDIDVTLTTAPEPPAEEETAGE